jgi:hypothetical protein
MECDICGQEVGNSEALQKHKEQVHPVGEQDDSPLEKPDPVGEPIEPDQKDTPEPAQLRR